MAILINSFKCSKLLCISIISFFIIVLIMVGFIVSYHVSIENIFEKSINYNTQLIKGLSIVNTKSKKYVIISQNDTLKNFDKAQTSQYKSFLEKYLEIQANWLNAWLTILAIILGLLGIAIPICFTKFYENKKIEIEKYKFDLEHIRTTVQQKNNQLVRLLSDVRGTNQRVKSLFQDLDTKNLQIDTLIVETQQIQRNIRDENSFRQKHLDDLLNQTQLLQNEIEKEAITIKEKSNEITNIYHQIQNYAEEAQKIKLDTEANNYMNMSFHFCKDNQYLEALSQINKAIELRRKPEYLAFRAFIYSKMKNYSKSIDDYIEAISQKANDFPLHISLGVVFLQAGQLSQAIDILNKAKELNPRHPIAYYNLTEAYIRNNEYKRALEALTTYISLENSPFIMDDDKKTWTEALDLAPRNSDVKKIKAIIEAKLTLRYRNCL